MQTRELVTKLFPKLESDTIMSVSNLEDYDNSSKTYLKFMLVFFFFFFLYNIFFFFIFFFIFNLIFYFFFILFFFF